MKNETIDTPYCKIQQAVVVLLHICVACIVIFLSANSVADNTNNSVLRIAGWDVYADPENPNKIIGYTSFEEETGIEIEYTPLNNLDAIINAAESDKHYDLFIISNEGIKILHDMELVQSLDLKLLSHYQDLYPSLIYSSWNQFDGMVYAVPWAWGPTGLLYDADQIPEPDSWNILWDPKYHNRVALWDDVSMIWITALSLGYTNVYNLTRTQLQEVREKLLQLNGQVYNYYSGSENMLQYILDNNIILLDSWFDPRRRLTMAGRNFKMIMPKEGAVGMFDSYLISKDSRQRELAHHFINHQISPAVQQQMVYSTGLPPANMETLTLLSSEEISSLHLNEKDYFHRMILWNNMPRKHLYDEVLRLVRENYATMNAPQSK